MTLDFVARVRALEQELFGAELQPVDALRIKSERYSWHYPPSHHVKTGLVTEVDIEKLSKPGFRLLSVGAHPAYLERLLLELGALPENIVVGDIDPAFAAAELPFKKHVFSMIEEWPEIGTFDLIIFPESLCIALSDELRRTGPHGDGDHASDPLEAELLTRILKKALSRLRPGGEIRANGPQSHPNVVTRATEALEVQGVKCEWKYQRYFSTLKKIS